MKFCNFYPHLILETEFLKLKLTQTCYINMKNYFIENWQFNHKLTPLSYTHTKIERPSSQLDKIRNEVKFKSSNFPTLPILPVESQVIFKNPIFHLFHELEKSENPKQSNITNLNFQSFCELGKF